jgi:hypothetical protein
MRYIRSQSLGSKIKQEVTRLLKARTLIKSLPEYRTNAKGRSWQQVFLPVCIVPAVSGPLLTAMLPYSGRQTSRRKEKIA